MHFIANNWLSYFFRTKNTFEKEPYPINPIILKLLLDMLYGLITIKFSKFILIDFDV